MSIICSLYGLRSDKVCVHFLSNVICIRCVQKYQEGQSYMLQFPVMEPVFSKHIEIIIMDANNPLEAITDRDERMASLRIDYAKFKKNHKIENEKGHIVKYHMERQWMYAYGAKPGSQRGGYAHKMNHGIVEGTHSRGAFLVECEMEKVNKVMQIKDRFDGYKKKRLKGKSRIFKEKSPVALPMVDYLEVELYEGAEINNFKLTKQSVSVKVSISDAEKDWTLQSESKPIFAGNNRVEWYQKLRGEDLSDLTGTPTECIGPIALPKDWRKKPLIAVPDVFIYLCIGGEPVAYRRVPLREITKNIYRTPQKGTHCSFCFKVLMRVTSKVFSLQLRFSSMKCQILAVRS